MPDLHDSPFLPLLPFDKKTNLRDSINKSLKNNLKYSMSG